MIHLGSFLREEGCDSLERLLRSRRNIRRRFGEDIFCQGSLAQRIKMKVERVKVAPVGEVLTFDIRRQPDPHEKILHRQQMPHLFDRRPPNKSPPAFDRRIHALRMPRIRFFQRKISIQILNQQRVLHLRRRLQKHSRFAQRRRLPLQTRVTHRHPHRLPRGHVPDDQRAQRTFLPDVDRACCTDSLRTVHLLPNRVIRLPRSVPLRFHTYR